MLAQGESLPDSGGPQLRPSSWPTKKQLRTSQEMDWPLYEDQYHEADFLFERAVMVL